MYKIVRYDKAPFGGRFRYKGNWCHISPNSLEKARHFNGRCYIQYSMKHNPYVGLDLKFTT